MDITRGVEEIYFSKTKEYFGEIMSNYANGNYRSAVVMLYSVAICDLLYKLKELDDVYNDSIAREILLLVEKNKKHSGSKSAWEKEFVDQIYNKTEILDSYEYTNLNNLYSYRNFSAHPAINDNYELIAPSRELTIAFIKQTLEGIFIKPPIFANKIIDVLTEDISAKKEIFYKNKKEFKNYLYRKYFTKMSDTMKKSTLTALWKFCFCSVGDENCSRNRDVNRIVVSYLYETIQDVISFMRNDSRFQSTTYDNDCCIQLIYFLADHPEVYRIIGSDTKLQLDKFLEMVPKYKILAWFKSTSVEAHIDEIMKNNEFINWDRETLDYVHDKCVDEGIETFFLDLCVKYYGESDCFDQANNRYESAIIPYLADFSEQQIRLLLEVSNNNSQIHARRGAYASNGQIIKQAKKLLPNDFDYSSNYPLVKFDKSIL